LRSWEVIGGPQGRCKRKEGSSGRESVGVSRRAERGEPGHETGKSETGTQPAERNGGGRGGSISQMSPNWFSFAGRGNKQHRELSKKKKLQAPKLSSTEDKRTAIKGDDASGPGRWGSTTMGVNSYGSEKK